MKRLEGKRTLITGGTTGIGLETARLFLEEGARVAITGRNPATLEAARKELGSAVLALASDASDAAAQKAVAGEIQTAFGGLDAVFVNANKPNCGQWRTWDEAAYDRLWAVNFKGPYFLIQALLPVLANPASIVLNGSVNAHINVLNSSMYLRGVEGGADLVDADPVRRADRARNPGERGEPGPHRDAAVRQAGILG